MFDSWYTIGWGWGQFWEVPVCAMQGLCGVLNVFDQSFPFAIARQNMFVTETLIISTRDVARVLLPEWMTSSK